MRRWVLRSGLVFATAVFSFTAQTAYACNQDVPVGAFGHVHGAQAEAAPQGNPGATKGVRLLANLPEAAQAISINFLQYGRRDVMIVAGQFGLKSYDITRDPARPKFLSEVSMPGIWEMEDTDVDPARKLVFMSRDPRAFGGNTHTGVSGIYTVDASNPENLQVISFVEVPAGHTTSCVNRCQFVWTGGPAKADSMPA